MPAGGRAGGVCGRAVADVAGGDVVRVVGGGDCRLLHPVSDGGAGGAAGCVVGAARPPGSGLAGEVSRAALQTLLGGRDPMSGSPLGRELVDRVKADGTVVRAVAGFDATFSAPKSLSVWWALTGDDRLLEAHDAAVTAALEHLERFGSTTRVRVDGRRLHPDTHGLTIAAVPPVDVTGRRPPDPHPRGDLGQGADRPTGAGMRWTPGT